MEADDGDTEKIRSSKITVVPWLAHCTMLISHWCLFCYYLFMALECKSHFNRNIHVGVPVGQS